MPEEHYAGSVGTGFSVAALGNFGGFLLCLGLLTAGMGYPLVGFGITQFLWLFPLWRHYRKEGETESAKGVILLAGISFLLNAACWTAMKV
jgi:hypothetical protein